MRTLAGLGILILLVVMAGVLMHHLISKRYPVLPTTRLLVIKTPRFEIYPKNDIPPHKPIPKTKYDVLTRLPQLAIIIDDIGYDETIAQKFLDLDAVLTFSILPHSTHDKRIAKLAHSKGFDVMYNLPIESNEYPLINPGPGVVAHCRGTRSTYRPAE